MSNSAELSDPSRAHDFRIELSYSGPTVVDGSIPVDDLLSSLQGFATAFHQLARTRGLAADRLGLRAAGPGSFIVVLALLQATDISAGAAVFSAAAAVVSLIIHAVKGTRDSKSEEQVDIEGALVKLTTPLRKGQIETIQIRAEYGDRVIHQTLTVEDKAALNRNRRSRSQASPSAVRKRLPEVADEHELITALKTGSDTIKFFGTIETLKKSTKEGELVLQDGTTVACRLVGPEPERLYHFFAYVRPLRIIGSPQFTDGSLSSINVIDIEAD